MTAVPTLFISGTCGAGKSTIAAEIHEVLAESKIPNTAVDLTALTWHWPVRGPFNSELKFENLAAIWPNFHAHGTTRLVLAGVLRDGAELARYRQAVPGSEIVVCRLVVPQSLRIERLCRRIPPGSSRDWHLNRTVELEEILEHSHAEDFTVANDDRSVREVALDVLAHARWL